MFEIDNVSFDVTLKGHNICCVLKPIDSQITDQTFILLTSYTFVLRRHFLIFKQKILTKEKSKAVFFLNDLKMSTKW